MDTLIATDHRLHAVVEALDALLPVPLEGVTAATPLRDLAPSGMVRSWAYHAMARLTRSMPDEALGDIATVGELAEWVGVRWNDDVPQDLVAATSTDVSASRRLSLRPVLGIDTERIYLAATHPASGFRFRYKGTTPSPDEVTGSLWSGTHAVLVAHHEGSPEPLGLLVAYQASLGNGTAYVAFQRLSVQRPQGETFEAMFHFIEFLFRTWPLRKLYAEVPGYNERGVWGGAQDLFVEEGRLRDHEFLDGRWWDLSICSLTADRWQRAAGPWRHWLTGPSAGSVG